ncbi:phosphopantothenate--cysteine ligase [Enterococcus sp. BWT-B8]|uniref:phosphopantothenate--cysteine ligase n=1 Tax=Enterococcus sp. BWT-B8 TaxID=2885157 RepID=UPI001E2D416D|nr:phosphopantothenate--cysteine ligase [Enterococcus sp. BWT-B8]MCB5952421.1 phosphopantothenate--cysteine ligase [Enterococcus sp. BWT-B8]
MKVLITAGGTSEKIDNVRSITNHSTGRLGRTIAEIFLEKGHQVIYLTTPYAVRPAENKQLTVIEIETTAELQQQMKMLLSNHNFDSIIHSMAVSDFSSEISIPEEELIQNLTKKLQKEELSTGQKISEIIKSVLDSLGQQSQSEKKISSNTDRLLLFLKKNPKIIAMIREHQPDTILVGFKLLVGVTDNELINVGTATLEKNHCDFVLANDLENIQGNNHRGLLIHADHHVETADTKKEIAQLIVKNVEKLSRF